LHAIKIIIGFEGVYITTNDEALAKRLSIMRGFGFQGQDDVREFGTNAKLNEIHAAMALASLDDLEDQVERNRQRYYLYCSALSDLSYLRLLTFNENEKTSYKNIIVELLDDWPLTREDTLNILNSEGALARPYYSPPLHRREMKYPYIQATLPITDAMSEKFMLLPCGHMVSRENILNFVQLLIFLHANAAEINGRLRP
jgi:dTDP-4-amino-4,6-dideoxygalactose transaminase